MTDRREESIRRLERLGNAGFLDSARWALRGTPPVLAEMGLTVERAQELIDAPISRLESFDGSPSMLEAIVLAVGRPPLIVRGGKVEGKHTLGKDFPADVSDTITRLEPALASVGRIEFGNHDLSWGGTGWVVEEKPDHLLVITNRHVAQLVARRAFRGAGVFLFAPGGVQYQARIDFLEEADAVPDPAMVFEIERFTYIAEDAAADIALARIARPAAGAGFIPRALDLADGEDKEMVAVIGYPAKDSLRNDPTEMGRYFQNLYDVKRFAPGFLGVQPGPTILGHDCTTLGGNSGAPVISMKSGKVVGLHYAGLYGVGNSAVRVSTIRALLDGSVPTSVQGATIDATERPDGRREADSFVGREGYDPEFLQVVPVPLPKLPANFELVTPSDATPERPHELRYQNFGILYSGALKLPIIAALNLDGQRYRPQKRGSDQWFADLRIPAELQLGMEDYDDPEIDRGHLIRRAATNWGDDEEQARRADADSFHYTVAAPQHSAFNRSSAQWLGLEDYVLESARTHGFRACVFVGPVITGEEPELKATGAPIPLKFFKVVAMLAEEEGSNGILRLHATAYMLSQVQAIQQLLSRQGSIESAGGFALGAFKTFQLRISDLEELTGIDFGDLRAADPLARRVGEAEAEGFAPRPVVELDSLESIVL